MSQLYKRCKLLFQHLMTEYMFSRFGSATSKSHFGIGTDPFLLDDVNCTGEEASILECPNSGWKVHDCNVKTEVAGVRCSNTTTTGEVISTGSVNTHLLFSKKKRLDGKD